MLLGISRHTRAINNVFANPKNWTVSEIIKENHDVVRIPLDISSYCKNLFEKCSKLGFFALSS
jgi:hypothetical protein